MLRLGPCSAFDLHEMSKLSRWSRWVILKMLATDALRELVYMTQSEILRDSN